MTMTVYGDITPRTAAYAVVEMLKRGMPHLVIEKFGQNYPIPTNNTKVAKFRRYYLQGATGMAGPDTGNFGQPLALTPLVEGVTPTGKKLISKDYTATLAQYGDFVTITDVVRDTHEDPVLNQAIDVLGEQAAQTIETIRFNILKAGTNVFYANGSVRTSVNTALSLNLQRNITRALQRQNGRMITQPVMSTPNYRTEPIEAAFIALCHPDLEKDIRALPGFISTKQYGTVTPWENEIGSVERVRYLSSTIFEPWLDAGGAHGGLVLTTSGTSADVYPILFLSRDAYGIVPLKGKASLTPMVVNPSPAPGDPLAQRGTAGWKAMTTALILADQWMVRAEVAASV